MAKFTREDGRTEVEITDAALVIGVLGLAGALLVGLWMATRDQRTLKQLCELAASRDARLLHAGSALRVR